MVPPTPSVTLFALLVVCLADVRGQQACRDGEAALARRELLVAESKLNECVRSAPPKLEHFLWLCGVYQLQRNEDGLYRASREGLKHFPSEKRFTLSAATYAGRRKMFAEAVAVMDPALKLWPDDPQIRRLAGSALAGRGMALLDAGQNAEAEKFLRRAVALDSGDIEAQFNLGRALHNLHRLTDAVAIFESLLARDPKLALARFHRGLGFYALGDFPRAINDMTAELAITPGYAPALLTRGLSRIATGEWDLALADLEPASEAMPADAKAHYGRGRCLARLGKNEAAEAAFRRSAALDPEDPGPVHALSRLLMGLGRKEEAAVLAERAALLNARQRSAR